MSPIILTACVDFGRLEPKDDVPTDEQADTNEAVAHDTDPADPVRRSCTPHELTWRADNAPRIGSWGMGGIAWHPKTGLRMWGGCELDVIRDTGSFNMCSRGWLGPAERPWRVPAERWQSIFVSPDALCMVRGDGSFACREDTSWTPPSPVAAAGMPFGLMCAYTTANVPWVAQPLGLELPAWTDRERAPMAVFGGRLYENHRWWSCVHDDHGGVRCDAPSAIKEVFEDPERCWVEVASPDPVGLCGLDDAGRVSCASAEEWYVPPPTLIGSGLSHLTVQDDAVCGIDETGVVLCTGFATTRPFGDRADFVDVKVVEKDVCALDRDGRVSCSGPGQTSFAFANPDGQ